MDRISLFQLNKNNKKNPPFVLGVVLLGIMAFAGEIFSGTGNELPSLIGFKESLCGTNFAQCYKPLPSVTNGKIYHFLMIGSSNMVGRSLPTSADFIPDPQVISIDLGYGGWKNTIEPAMMAPGISGGGQSCALAFGKRYAALHPDRYVGLLCCGQIGKMLNSYSASKFGVSSAWGPIFGLDANGKKSGVDMIDYATNQGYHVWGGLLVINIPMGSAVNEFADQLKRMIDSARIWLKEPNLPVIIAEPAPFEYSGNPETFKLGSEKGKAWLQVIHDLPERIPYTAYINTADCKCLLESGEAPATQNVDRATHFDHTSQIKIGQRFAEALDLLEQQSSVKHPVVSSKTATGSHRQRLSICYGTPRLLKPGRDCIVYNAQGNAVSRSSSLWGIWIIKRR
jgi:hypothetical protein